MVCLIERIDSGKRTCSPNSRGCLSILFPTENVIFSKVCGRQKAYQTGCTDAFNPHGKPSPTINTNYFDGVSLTHGNPRQHIWTFAAALLVLIHLQIAPALEPVKQALSHLLQHLWGMTTSVTQVVKVAPSLVFSMVKTLCGMGLGVGLRTHAALSIALHGSTSNCHSPPLTIIIEMRVCRNDGSNLEDVSVEVSSNNKIIITQLLFL